MSEVSATNVILAALGVGGVSAALWAQHKLTTERKIRETLETELAMRATLRATLPSPATRALPPAPPPRNDGNGSTVQSLTAGAAPVR